MQVSADYVVEIATPCDVPWSSMQGTKKKRFCGECNLFVYNLPEMTNDEQIDFMRMAQAKGKACARIYTRPDGKSLTQNCSVGQRVKKVYSACKLAVALFVAAVLTRGLVEGVSILKQRLELTLSQSFSTVASQTGNIYIPPATKGQ